MLDQFELYGQIIVREFNLTEASQHQQPRGRIMTVGGSNELAIWIPEAGWDFLVHCGSFSVVIDE